MLNSTDISIKEIAYRTNMRPIARAFKAEFELSPTRYRQRLDISVAA
jgi:transcriptional regulator GlxA family with amidase domain